MESNDNLMVEKETYFCVLHTNDTHSYLEDFAKRGYLISKIREKNAEKGIDTFLLDCGDVITGSIYFSMYEGKKEAELMKKLKYDAMTFGNHEFDCAPQVLVDFLNIIDFPIVSANVDLSQDSHFKNQIVDKKVVPFIIKELNNGEKIAIFGLTTETTIDTAIPSEDIIFHDPIEVARQTVKKINELDVNKIILLSHLGKDEDQKLAEAVDGIDIIIGGHSHSLLKTPLIVQKQGSITAIVQAGEYGKFLGELTLTFDGQGNLKEVTEVLHNLAETEEEEEELKVIVDECKEEKERISSKIVGETAVDLNGEREQVKLGETNLGNLVVDAFYCHAQQLGFNPDIAVFNGMGIRASIPKGPISFGDVVKVLPFSETLMIIEATGKEIIESLKYGLFPQVAGIKVCFDLSNPFEERLTKIRILKNGNEEPIKEEEKYIIATNSFVASGKDNFLGFKNAKLVAENINLDVNILAEFLASLPQPIHYQVDQRLVYENRELEKKN